MRIFRKLLKFGLTLVVVVACVVGVACLVKRQVYVAICDAFPVAIEEPGATAVELDLNPHLSPPGELSGNAYIASEAESEEIDPDAGRARTLAAIEAGLPDATAEDREIWLTELKGESPEDIREILSLHRRLSPPQMLSGGDRQQERDGLQLMSADAPPPQLLQPHGLPRSPESPLPIRGSDDALRLLESSIKAIQSAEQVILNNIANANTTGFKRSRVLFGDEPYQHVALPGQVDQEGRPTTSGIALGAGTRILANQVDVSQGRLRQTQQALDLAIQGEGYFQIKDGNRILFARAGSFAVNANGEIVLASKDRARPLEPAFTYTVRGVEKIMVSPEGLVEVLQPGQSQMTLIGQVMLAQFVNRQGLMACGDNLFEANAASGNPCINTPGRNGVGQIRQGALEESNVVMADELSELRRMQEQLMTLQKLLVELGGQASAGR